MNEQTLTPTDELSLAATLLPLVTQRQALAAEIKRLQSQVDTLTEQITGEMVRAGEMKLEVGDWVPDYASRERKTLDKTRLVELGVSTEVIKQAEKTTTFMQLDVRKKGGAR